jgi:transketolase
MKQNNLKDLTNLIRYDIVTSTTAAGSGHPTSSLSAVELMTVLHFDGHFHYNYDDPKYIYNDRLIFSKGHASPLYYAQFHAAGQVKYEELLTLRKIDSNLEGHPTPRFKFVDVSTGSLGQGLSVGLGMALGIKYYKKAMNSFPEREPMVWVLLGDSEVAEGQVWEAMEVAAFHKVNNLVGILDVNRLGQRGATMLEWDLGTYKKRVEAFGWNAVVVEEGNDLEAVQKAFNQLPKNDKPTMIIAKTQKGAGISSVADKDNWHGKPLTKEMTEEAIKEIGPVDTNLVGEVNKPEMLDPKANAVAEVKIVIADGMATREAYGEALKAIANNPKIVVLDAEVSNSTYSEKFKKDFPDRFFEMYIAEQNMISVGLGMSKVGLMPYSSTFAAFLTRAYDQIRMAQYSEGNVKIAGSHAGVSIGVDGSSQMALEDIAMIRAILEGVVLYPSDAVSTVALVKEMEKHHGISYLRLTREKSKNLYKEGEQFPIGGSKVLKSSEKDKAVVIGAGITLHEALKAYDELKAKGTDIAVIDAYSVKPIDSKTIGEHARKTGHVIVVEDHYPDGGIGDAVLKVIQGIPNVKFTHLAVNKIPRSGQPNELLQYEDIDAQAIINII